MSSNQKGRVVQKSRTHQYGAASLGDVQARKPISPIDPYNKHRLHCTRRAHNWLFGTDNAVCSRCGETVPKDQTAKADADSINPPVVTKPKRHLEPRPTPPKPPKPPRREVWDMVQEVFEPKPIYFGETKYECIARNGKLYIPEEVVPVEVFYGCGAEPVQVNYRKYMRAGHLLNVMAPKDGYYVMALAVQNNLLT